eukprot:5890742-Amphidinium_carterae.1
MGAAKYWLARVLMLSGRLDRAGQVVAEAIDNLSKAEDKSGIAHALLMKAQLNVLSGQRNVAEDFAQQACRVAADSGDCALEALSRALVRELHSDDDDDAAAAAERGASKGCSEHGEAPGDMAESTKETPADVVPSSMATAGALGWQDPPRQLSPEA